MRKTISICIGTATGITILAFALNAASQIRLNAKLEHTRQELEQLEPSAEKIRTAQAALSENTQEIAECKVWEQGSGLPMTRVFQSIVENLPTQMAIYHLSAGAEQNSTKDPLICSIYISGVANGMLSAIETKQQFNTDSSLRRFCGELKLASSKRHSAENWAFALRGSRTQESRRK